MSDASEQAGGARNDAKERAPRPAEGRVLSPALFRSSLFWACVGSVGLAMLFGHAQVLHFRSGIVGGRSDGYENAWNDYWLRTALLHLHRSPFFTTYVEYPTGVSLLFHALNPFGGLLALPLVPLLGPVATINLKVLLSLACGTLFAFLLIRELTGAPLAAFAGAAVYTFANEQIVLNSLTGTLNYLMGSALLPLAVLFLLRVAIRPRWQRDAVAALLVLLALCLTDWQYTIFAVLFALFYFLFVAVTRRDGAVIVALFGRFALVGGLFGAIVLLPFLLPMVREARANPWLTVSESASAHSRSLLDFFRLGVGGPGYLVLGVTLVGGALLWRRGPSGDRATVIFWGALAAFGIALSLGPRLKLTPDGVTRIPLPYVLWYRAPVVSVSRKPFLFFASLGMLAVGVLLAFGLRELLPRLRDALARRAGSRRSWHPASRVVPPALVAVLLAATLTPYLGYTRRGEVDPPQWPAFYRDVLARDPEPYAILELPLFAGPNRGRSEGLYNAYQIVHGKFRFSSSISRDHKAENPNLMVRRGTLFRDFLWFDKTPTRELSRPTGTADFLATPAYPDVSLALLNYYHVRYIVLYLDALQDTGRSAVGSARNIVHESMGDDVRPVYEDALMEVYRVPERPPLATPLFIDTGSTGWGQAEKAPDGVPYRWADTRGGAAAELVLFNLSAEPRPARVQFTLFNYKGNRHVSIALNGQRADEIALADSAVQDVTLNLTIPPGMSTLDLSSPEAPVPLQTAGKPGSDDRLLSFGLRQVRLTP